MCIYKELIMQNIFVMDESNDLLEVITVILANEETKIFTCNSTNSLFNNLQLFMPDLLILDVMHSQINKKFIKEDLRTQNGLQNIPILITSTKIDHVNDYLDFGADSGLEMPFDISTLISKVKFLLKIESADNFCTL